MKSVNKKIHFIHPSCYNEKGQIVKIKRSLIPLRALPHLAALTPPQFETRITDEQVETLHFFEEADLVAISGMVNRIPRAIDIAKEYKKMGKKVIIGGIGAYALQNEIEKLDIFDSIVIGEAEITWNIVLDDFESGNLKKIYPCQPLEELKGLPFARFDLLNPKNYRKSMPDPKNFVVPIETSRGCPHGCLFCSVTQYWGKTMRYRPISELIDEIKYHRSRYFFFTDDNIAINHDRAKELLLAIKPLGIYWMGQFEAGVVNNPEIVRLASESGCRMALVGVESLNEDNIISIQKKRNLNIQVKELIQCLKKENIRGMISVMFGLDHDTPESMMETVDFMIDNKVELMLPWILTPFPRTPLHDRFKKENLLLHDNYSLYDAVHCVFKPGKFKPDELERTYWHAFRHFYKLNAIPPRVFNNNSLRRIVRMLIFELYMRHNVYHGRHPFSH